MRVTDGMRVALVTQIEQRAAERVLTTSRIASSGNRVDAPSDDPTAYASLQTRGARIQTMQARKDAASRASGDLTLAETTLASASDVLTQARALAVQMSNGSMSAQDRAAAAQQVTAMRDQLVALGNTKGANGYLFGGTKTDTAPFDTAGAFHGNAGVTHVEIADGVLAVSNAGGANAFTAAGGNDVFATLTAFASALTTNNVSGITGAIDGMDKAHAQMVAARVDAGTRAAGLTSAAAVMTGALASLNVAQANEGQVDAPAAYSDLTTAQTTYQRSLDVTKQLLALGSGQG